MGVIPGGSNPVPEGGQSAADMAALQLVTEDSVRSQVSGKALAPWGSAHNSFFGTIIGGIGSALAAGIAGIGNTVGAWASSFFDSGAEVKDIRDGQEDLVNRLDLLAGVNGYVFSYMAENVNVEWSGNNWRDMPFSRQLGPAKEAGIEGNRIKLHGKGLWLVMAKCTANPTTYGGSTLLKLQTDVYLPSGGSFHRSTASAGSGGQGGIISNQTEGGVLDVFPVVVDEEDCTVGVQSYSGAWRWWQGGYKTSMLAAIRFSTDVVNPGDETVPNETNPNG